MIQKGFKTIEELNAHLAAQQQAEAEESAVRRMAAAEPLPGPCRDAFAIQPDIPVGNYRVRPFYDIDFELLSLLEHPLYQMMVAGMTGQEAKPEAPQYIPRGPAAWELAYLMTTDPDEVEKVIAQGGTAALKAAARKQFGRLQLVGLAQLSAAAMQQMSRYWAPVLQYGPAGREGEQSPNPSTP